MRERSTILMLCVAAVVAACSDGGSAPMAPRASLEPGAARRAADPVWSAWSTPENLGGVINTTGIEQHPTISKDGLSLFFASDRAGTRGGLDLWVSHRASKDDPWGAPENLGPNINSAGNDLAAAFTRNGHTLYFHSNGRGGCGGSDLFVAYRTHTQDDLAWEPAQNLGCSVNSSLEDAGPTIWEDKETGLTTLLFTSTRGGGLGDFDIYQTTRVDDDSPWSTPLNFTAINSPFRDTRTTITRDQLTLFISSDVTGRTGGIGGQDLWMSTREDFSSPWSTPVNLGAGVNSSTFDGAPSISFDGTELYFFSDRGGGFGKNDLYVTRRTRLHP